MVRRSGDQESIGQAMISIRLNSEVILWDSHITKKKNTKTRMYKTLGRRIMTHGEENCLLISQTEL